MSNEIKALRRQLAAAERASAKASEARANLPMGSTRARVSTANARWKAAAEHRDRLAEQLRKAEAEAAEEDEPLPF